MTRATSKITGRMVVVPWWGGEQVLYLRDGARRVEPYDDKITTYVPGHGMAVCTFVHHGPAGTRPDSPAPYGFVTGAAFI
jgi:hypothetical protein